MLNTFFLLFLFTIILKYVWEIALDVLNLRYSTGPSARVPDILKDRFSPEDFEKAKRYLKDKVRLATLEKITSLILTLFYVFYLFPTLDKSLSSGRSVIIQALIFFGIYAAIEYVVELPFKVYSTFVIEQKYGFNTTTAKLFIRDQILQILLAVIIGAPIIAGIIWFLVKFPVWWWQLSILAFVILIFFMIIQPILIAPLFFKFSELENEELKSKIRAILDKARIKVPNIYKMDASKRTKKQNAYLTGIGKSRRLVLFDNILSYNQDEILAVVGHELGHHAKRHIPKLLVLNALLITFTFFIANAIYKFLMETHIFGVSQPYTVFAYAFMFVSSIMFFLEPVMNYFSRKMEYEADEYSAKLLGSTTYLISSLKRLVKENLSNPNPMPLYKIWYYSHPAPEERIKRLMEVGQNDR